MLPIIDIIKALVSNTNCNDNFEAIVLNQSLIYEDNNGAYTVATNCRVTSRTKYFNVKWHHFWQFVHNKTFQIERINTEDQRTEYLTKGLPSQPYEKHRKSTQGW